jgi:hypothetical protein
MKILLGDFNAKVGGEDIFKPTVCHIQKSAESAMFPHSTFINLLGHFLMERHITRSTIF